ncbi:hypothetical protein EJB05_21761 [Eragrostis curvula]|uniref:F-box domain-containing protein n=1 Tax=Eragrostis curvula TaxID=38414 RepID=A0A5J9V1Q9_9POAL|nr:hypothetical protein EJB05_21761 [Eragrostis curvula]
MEDTGASRGRGSDPSKKDGGMDTVLTRDVLTCLPAPPVSIEAPLAHALAKRPPADGVDRISRLPVEALRNIVSRLPARDAARTTVLSTRWRRIWHSVPLVLVDAHLIWFAEIIRLLGHDADPRDYRTPPLHLTAAVSGALDAHPGPFRCVYITGSDMVMHDVGTARWFQILAAKGVQELVFVNRNQKQMDVNVHRLLPPTLFKCTSLTRLYLGFWRFPETATLPRSAAFPYLREVGLCSLIMKEQDLAFLLDRCPVLEKLIMVGCKWPVCLRIQSRSLRCVQMSYSIVTEITTVHASLLERLLLWEVWGEGGRVNMTSKIKFGHAPKLRVLGMLVPGMHKLHIGNTIIKDDTKASPNTIVPSVQVLALQVRLGTRTEARMVPSFLRCFPNVEILYIQSEDDDFKIWGPESGGKVSLKFWEKAGPIECIQRHIKKLVIRIFQGKKGELNFLKFIAEHARVLEKMEIVLHPQSLPLNEVDAKVRTFMASAKWANGCCELTVSPYQAHICTIVLNNHLKLAVSMDVLTRKCFACMGLVSPLCTDLNAIMLWLYHNMSSATKFAERVKEFVFANLAAKHDADVHLPATIFRCTALTKLYIASWWFPDTADLPRATAFPYMQELGLCNLIMKEQDLAFMLDRCPVLEKLMISRSRWPVCVRIQSHSLRCVQVCTGIVPEVTVVNASRLERLFLWEAWGGGDLAHMSSKVKIGHAPKLRFLGFLVPGMHQLEIGNIVIKAKTKASPDTTVPSVQMLGVHVKLGTRIEAGMLPSFLRCFPNVKTLYVQSENDDDKFWGPHSSGIGKLNPKFWKEAGPIECIQRHIKKLVLREFRGKRSELDFLKFIAEHAQVLEEMVVVMTHGYLPSDQVGAKLRTVMASAKWANGSCRMMVLKSPFDQEGNAWCYIRGFNFSEDPFDVSKCRVGKCEGHY